MEQKIDIKKLIASKNPNALKWIPSFVISYLKRILHQDDINGFLHRAKDKYDEDFCDAVMDLLDLDVIVKHIDRLPKDEKLVLVMNHPLGGLDAVALVSGLRSKLTGLKFIVNDLLLFLGNMNGLFLGVDKHGKISSSKKKQIEDLFASEHVVCIFPAGLVSRKTEGKVRDLPWKKTYLSLSKKYNRTIVPIYIEGRLSPFFYRLSNFRKWLGIKTNIEMLYLSNELFKLKGSKIVFTIGHPVSASSLNDTKTDAQWSEEIRQQLYALAVEK